MVKKIGLVGVFFFILSFCIYLISSKEPTGFNHFAYLADAFLQKKIYVSLEAPWLEQVPIDSSHFFVPYPPLPAILLMPFRFVFKNLFLQDYLSYFLGAGAVFLMVQIAFKLRKDYRFVVWVALLSGFGTIVWYMSSIGSSWYIGQISAYFFLTFALHEGLNKKRPFLIGVFLGAAYLSRIETIVSLPLFLYLQWNSNWKINLFKIFSGIAPFIFFNFCYNFARFGVIWDKAYTLIPGVTTEPWFSKGLVNISYIPNHLKIIFGGLPAYNNIFPYFKPGYGGLAIWFTTPAFIYSLFANIKERVNQFAWISIILISLVIFSHGSTGFAQFGYRFAVDFYPFLLFLTIKSVSKTGLKWHHWLLLILSILVNLWGVLWLNKFDWINW